MKSTQLSFEQKWKKLVAGEDRSWRRYLLWPLLKGCGLIYGSITHLRNQLYRHGYLKCYWPGCYVISVGNITVGGTGKTPVVAVLAKALAKGGRKVAIISRGYKAKKPSLRFRLSHGGDWSTSRVVSDGREILLTPRLAGDEPYMLAKNLPGVIVITDTNRVRGARLAMREFGVDTIILDDGMQHLKMKRQRDIVLLDSTCPFGYERILPGGLLREPLSGLKRADQIILTKAENLTKERKQEITEEIRYYNKRADILTCHYVPDSLRSVVTDREVPLDLLQALPVMVVSGIAQPQGFCKLLEANGAKIVGRRLFPDHHRFTRDEIKSVYSDANALGAQAVLMTEKDAVRFPKKALGEDGVPVYYLKVSVDFGASQEDFTHSIESICRG